MRHSVPESTAKAMQARIAMILRHELSHVTCHVDSVAQTGVCFGGIVELESA
jgi:hypothetical protein